MKSFPTGAFMGVALASAIVLSVPGRAATLDAGGQPLAAATAAGAIRDAANAGTRAGTVDLSARKKKKARRRHRGSDAAIAAGMLGLFGGIIAAEQERRYDRRYWYRDDDYDGRWRRRERHRPRYRQNRHNWPNRCPGGMWTDEGGRTVCE